MRKPAPAFVKSGLGLVDSDQFDGGTEDLLPP